MLVDDIADRIAIACPAEIDAITKDMWADHAHGLLTDNEMETLDEAARARRGAIQTRRTETWAPRGSARSLRSIRSHTRRRLHEPRPAVSHETRKRIGKWKAEIKEAAKARHIRAVDRLYADELLAFPSVARGHYSLCSDATMGQRLDVSDSTARRQRRRLDKAGLIEVLGYGRDGKSCLVRPILRDGTPVFPDPEMPSRLVTSGHPPRSELTADLSTKTPKTEESPLPPASPDAAGQGREAFDRFEKEPTKPKPLESDMVSSKTAGVTDQVLARTQPPSPETTPAGSTAAPPATRPGPDAIEPAGTAMSFLQFWVAMGQTGREGYARAQWGKLSATDKAAIRDRLSRPQSWAADMWAGTWLKGRCWEETVPTAARPEQVFIRENTPEWRCWQRHLGRSIPVNSQGGWWFPSKLPPLTDAEVPSNGQAHSSPEAPLDAESCPQHFTRRWPAPGLCGGDDAGHRGAQHEKTKEVWE